MPTTEPPSQLNQLNQTQGWRDPIMQFGKDQGALRRARKSLDSILARARLSDATPR